ncbi:MAG: prepilin-type N-terminal cleavage/methylation domain-containing protein [Planctomycetes bacterium]|nr:prepilin-type N-terminal cleavage/methylation domain-containing protein [Planctomycetota bacterium]
MRKHRLRRSKRINTDYEMRGTRYEDGFSLIEVLIAILLVGLAIASLVTASSAFTKANGAGVELTTAEFLIVQVRERTVLVDYADLYAFDDESFSPPQNANGDVLNDLAAFSQQITVENVSDSDFEQVVPDYDPNSHFVRITVKVFLNLREISSARWLRARY